MLEFHKSRLAQKNPEVNKDKVKIVPFSVGINGNIRLCKYGRIVCGGDLGIAPPSSSLFNSKLLCSV